MSLQKINHLPVGRYTGRRRCTFLLHGIRQFKFNEAISLQVNCDIQQALDYYRDRLGAGGDDLAQQCGWFEDIYGVSWQIVPSALPEMMGCVDPRRTDRVMSVLLGMKKLDIAELQRADEV